LITVGSFGFTSNASAFFQSIGLDALQAALCISIVSAASIIWAPVFGTLFDRYGSVAGVMVCGLAGAIILVAASFIYGFFGAVIISLIVGALGVGAMLGPTTFSRLFGPTEAGSLVGFSNAAASIGVMLGAPLAGFIFDKAGSYNPYLWVAAALVVGSIALIALSMRLARRA